MREKNGIDTSDEEVDDMMDKAKQMFHDRDYDKDAFVAMQKKAEAFCDNEAICTSAWYVTKDGQLGGEWKADDSAVLDAMAFGLARIYIEAHGEKVKSLDEMLDDVNKMVHTMYSRIKDNG